MVSCFAFQGQGSDNNSYVYFACTTNPGWVKNSESPGGNYYSPASNGVNIPAYSSWWTTAGSIISCATQTDVTAASSGRGTGGSCSGCLNQNQKYDCLNGQCVVSTQYSTPGTYANLADCQAACANGGACAEGKQCIDPTNFCPPGKVCIEQSEFSTIEGLLSQINSEVC